MRYIAIGWIISLSIWSFYAMGYDKRQAKRGQRRTPEKKLWLLAIGGGGIGAYLGMQLFRHKTRHTLFRVGFVILAIADFICLLYLFGFRLPNTNKFL